MGAGIAAAIPLVFKPYDNDYFDGAKAEYFSQRFLENYTVEEKESANKSIRVMKDGSVKKPMERVYSIKKDLLIDNYRSLLTEFYTLIDEDLYKKTGMTTDGIPDTQSIDDFISIFGKNNSERRLPFVYKGSRAFSVLGCRCEEYWVFYMGSYKAYLEVYSTLLLSSRIPCFLANKNP